MQRLGIQVQPSYGVLGAADRRPHKGQTHAKTGAIFDILQRMKDFELANVDNPTKILCWMSFYPSKIDLERVIFIAVLELDLTDFDIVWGLTKYISIQNVSLSNVVKNLA